MKSDKSIIEQLGVLEDVVEHFDGFQLIGDALMIRGDNTAFKKLSPGKLCALMDVQQSVDNLAIVTDPPYGLGVHQPRMAYGFKKSSGREAYKPVHGDMEPFDPSPWLIGRQQILWGANHFAERLPKNGRWLCWDKRCQTSPTRAQADLELAWASDYGPARMFYHLWDGFLRDSEKGMVRIHPTQKPVALMEWCLEFISAPIIVDPFMGSGATGVAAIRAGRKFIGIELDTGYYRYACERIAKAQGEPLPDGTQQSDDQLDLFL